MFCRWPCAKAWNHTKSPVQLRWVRDMFIDDLAGRFVDARNAPPPFLERGRSACARRREGTMRANLKLPVADRAGNAAMKRLAGEREPRSRTPDR